MRNRILRLTTILGAGLSIASAAAAAQQVAFPTSLASAPAYEVPDRLLDHRTELALTGAQVAELAALSADLRAEERYWQRLEALSAKPWIIAARRPSPRRALDRMLRTLTPSQREPAIRVLASREVFGR